MATSSSHFHQTLEEANLLGYEAALLEQGIEDIQPLKDLSNEDFKQLCHIIGMSSQPLHVLRFKEALGIPLVSHQRNSQNETSVDMGPYRALSISNKAIARKHSSQQHTPTKTQSKNSASERGFFLPPYLQPDSECTSFEQLIDDHTPIQKELGPPPFTPATWDSKRRELIRKHSAIYGQHVNKRKTGGLNSHEENVNEAACQLCLRDPTLLTRRDELFVLARRAVKEGGYSFTHGHSKSKTPSPRTSGSKRKRREDIEVLNETSDPEESRPKQPHDHHHERLDELESLIKSKQEIAQHSNDFTAAYCHGNPSESLRGKSLSLNKSEHHSDGRINRESLMSNELPCTASDNIQPMATVGLVPRTTSQVSDTLGRHTSTERQWNITESVRQFDRTIYPAHFPSQLSEQPVLLGYGSPQVFDSRNQSSLQFHTHSYSVAGHTTPDRFQQ